MALLLNENGLVLANQENVDPKYPKVLSRNQIFELTAPNFTAVASQFAHYIPKGTNITEYNLSDEDLVLLRKFFLDDVPFFFLFYTKSPKSKANLVQDLTDLENKLSHLLKYYIT